MGWQRLVDLVIAWKEQIRDDLILRGSSYIAMKNGRRRKKKEGSKK